MTISPVHVIHAAAALLNGLGDPEYDRAITELTCDLLDISTDHKDTVLADLRTVARLGLPSDLLDIVPGLFHGYRTFEFFYNSQDVDSQGRATTTWSVYSEHYDNPEGEGDPIEGLTRKLGTFDTESQSTAVVDALDYECRKGN